MELKFIIDKRYDKSFAESKLAALQMDDQYRQLGKYLHRSSVLYQQSWDEIGSQFSRYIEKRTSYPWFYRTYECVVSVAHRGISNWGHEPKIVRWWKENPFAMRRITAHELILSHYFEIYRRHYSKEKLSEGQVWALAEIAAFALTSLAPTVKKFWPWNTSYYTDHNYPQIVELQKKLKTPFLSRSFDGYVRRGITLVRAYPRMGPEVK